MELEAERQADFASPHLVICRLNVPPWMPPPNGFQVPCICVSCPAFCFFVAEYFRAQRAFRGPSSRRKHTASRIKASHALEVMAVLLQAQQISGMTSGFLSRRRWDFFVTVCTAANTPKPLVERVILLPSQLPFCCEACGLRKGLPTSGYRSRKMLPHAPSPQTPPSLLSPMLCIF